MLSQINKNLEISKYLLAMKFRSELSCKIVNKYIVRTSHISTSYCERTVSQYSILITVLRGFGFG